MTVFIYALCCPLSGEIRYVGKTIRLGQRFSKHCSAKERTRNSCWVKSLKNAGLKPRLEILEEVDDGNEDDWRQAEKFWIAYCQFLGFNLTNLTTGGDSGFKVSESTREKLSKIASQLVQKPEYIELQRKSQIKRWDQPGAREEASKTIREIYEKNPARREQQVSIMRAIHGNEEHNKRKVDGIRKWCRCEEGKKQKSEMQIRRFKSKEARLRHADLVRAGIEKKRQSLGFPPPTEKELVKRAKATARMRRHLERKRMQTP